MLLLDGMSYKYLLSPPGLMRSLQPIFPYQFSVQMIYPLMKLGYWSLPLLLYYCHSLLLVILIFPLYIQVLLCWCVNVYKCYILLLDWLLYLYVITLSLINTLSVKPILSVQPPQLSFSLHLKGIFFSSPSFSVYVYP